MKLKLIKIQLPHRHQIFRGFCQTRKNPKKGEIPECHIEEHYYIWSGRRRKDVGLGRTGLYSWLTGRAVTWRTGASRMWWLSALLLSVPPHWGPHLPLASPVKWAVTLPSSQAGVNMQWGGMAATAVFIKLGICSAVIIAEELVDTLCWWN